MNPGDAEVKAYYDAHKSDYMTPETVNLSYVELSLADLAAKVSVDDAKLNSYYEEQKTKSPEHYVQPEQRHVRHILLQVADPERRCRRQGEGRRDFEARSGGRGFRQARAAVLAGSRIRAEGRRSRMGGPQSVCRALRGSGLHHEGR